MDCKAIAIADSIESGKRLLGNQQKKGKWTLSQFNLKKDACFQGLKNSTDRKYSLRRAEYLCDCYTRQLADRIEFSDYIRAVSEYDNQLAKDGTVEFCAKESIDNS